MNAFKANKLHIGIFGKRNTGKSTLMNILLGQDFSIVSDVLGTTTDVNQKSMELLPIGPVVLMDTAGIDDDGDLGIQRVKKTHKALDRTDCGIVVCDSKGLSKYDIELLEKLNERKLPYIILVNKTDVGKIADSELQKIKKYSENIIFTSLKNDKNIVKKIKNLLIKILPSDIINSANTLLNLLKPRDIAVLVVPIDKEAPKDRLILPQVMTIRNLLDNKCVSVITDVENLSSTLFMLKKSPKLVITDSQAFEDVAQIVPNDILLTSFSILFANFKGNLSDLVLGASKIDSLCDGDKILICESCTHHPIENDIGRVQIPKLIEKYTSKKLTFEYYSGYDFPTNIKQYALIIHCGACMTNRSEMLNRIARANEALVPITNYGVAIAKCKGILPRAIQLFEKIICFD